MKNKTALILMEQLVMILVFSLAAALCLRAFVQADRISWETEQRTRAAILAQNAAEILKSCGGDFEAADQLLGGTVSGGVLEVGYDREGAATADTTEQVLRLEITEKGSLADDLKSAQVCVFAEDVCLFSLQVVWRTS